MNTVSKTPPEGQAAVNHDKTSQPIHMAVRGGHLSTVELLLRLQPTTVDVRDWGGRTPLILSATRGLVDIAKTLIDAGAAINAHNEVGASAIHGACRNGSIEIVRLLMDKNADIGMADRDGCTGLVQACHHGHAEVVSLLLSRGANPSTLR